MLESQINHVSTPCLISFVYWSSSCDRPWLFPCISFLKPPSPLLKASIIIGITWGSTKENEYNEDCLLKLRRFLTHVYKSNASLEILGPTMYCFRRINVYNLLEQQQCPLEHQVEALMLDVSEVKASAYASVVENLFSTIRPKFIYITSKSWDDKLELVSFLHSI